MSDLSEVHEKINVIGTKVTVLEGENRSFYRRIENQDMKIRQMDEQFLVHQKESLAMHNKILGSLNTLMFMIPISVTIIIAIIVYNNPR
jgi:hypothetical protein